MCWECSSVALGAFNTAWHQCEPLHAEVALQPHVCWDTQRLRMGMLLSTLSRTSKQASVQESTHAIPSSRTARALPLAGPKKRLPHKAVACQPTRHGFQLRMERQHALHATFTLIGMLARAPQGTMCG